MTRWKQWVLCTAVVIRRNRFHETYTPRYILLSAKKSGVWKVKVLINHLLVFRKQGIWGTIKATSTICKAIISKNHIYTYISKLVISTHDIPGNVYKSQAAPWAWPWCCLRFALGMVPKTKFISSPHNILLPMGWNVCMLSVTHQWLLSSLSIYHHQFLTPATWLRWVQINDLQCPRSFVKPTAPPLLVFVQEMLCPHLYNYLPSLVQWLRQRRAVP